MYIIQKVLLRKQNTVQFNAQTYPNKELIIFNTDEEFPYVMENKPDNVTIVNNGIDYVTNVNYTNRGDICRD